MTILKTDTIRHFLRRENFQPGLLGVIINPLYIIRRGLHLGIKQFAPLIQGDVLDFGCGSKPYENLFTNARRYVGCDIKASGHDHKDSKIDYFYGGKSLPFEDASFDAVISFETFEHVANLSEILKEIYRITKHSGYLLITVPFAWEEHEVPYDFTRYTSFGITSVLKCGGYEVVELTKSTTYLLAVFQMLIAYLCQHIAPKNKLFYLFQVMFIFPLTMIAYTLNAVLPKKYEYFCNNVVLAKRMDDRPSESRS